MFKISDFILILGAGKTGNAVAVWLKERNMPYILWDEGQGATPALDWSRITHVVQSPGISPKHKIAQDAVAHGIQILTDIDIFKGIHPTARIIGITGTNGKSTTTALITHILKCAGLKVGMGGNIGTPVLSLPEISKTDGCYVFELSSYQLELSDDLNLDVAAWLNISEDHLERHGTMEGYIAAKKRIFNGAKNAVICLDDAASYDVYQSIKGCVNTITVSLKNAADVTVKDHVLYINGAQIVDLRSCPNLNGAHNYQNAAVAAGLAKTQNVSHENMTKAFMTFPGLEHRQQIVATHDKMVFVNDSKATNADAAEKALLAYQDHAIYWILGGRPKTDGITPLAYCLKDVRHAFVFGEAQEEFKTFLEKNNILTVKCDTLKRATAEAFALAQKECDSTSKQVILFAPACASFDQFKNFEERGTFFANTVRELLNE